MNLRRTILTLTLVLAAAGAQAATLSVGVRQISEHEQGALLLELVEQGAMDAMFQNGHIVFDLSVDPSAEFYTYLAMDQARRGGAAYAVLFDVSFAVSERRGLYPASVSIRLLNADDEEELLSGTVTAESIERFTDLDSRALAEAVGGAAAEIVVERLAGGQL